jgi:uncharacterized protein (TIGR02246 family)
MQTPDETVLSYFSALGDSNLEATVGLFTDDAVVMAENTRTATGRRELEATFEGAFANLKIQEQAEILSVFESEDMAVVVTRSTGTLTILSSAATTATAFRELFVLRRAGDRWRISHYIFNATPAAE